MYLLKLFLLMCFLELYCCVQLDYMNGNSNDSDDMEDLIDQKPDNREVKIYSEMIDNKEERKSRRFHGFSDEEIVTDVTSQSRDPKGVEKSERRNVYEVNTTRKDLKGDDYVVDTDANTIKKENTSKNDKYESYERSGIDFYNIEPRTRAKSDLTRTPDSLDTDSSESYMQTWYVVEKYPCWELPFLYARLSEKWNLSDVFEIHARRLENITIQDPTIEGKLAPNVYRARLEPGVGKWCYLPPCFGDHTLCLFNDKKTSNLCPKGYQVRVPSMNLQIHLVSTINAIRNRIANGYSKTYLHLPTAGNMKQIIYDLDLEKMAYNWLHQCLPGPPPCSSLDEQFVTQLECTKKASECCVRAFKTNASSDCIPSRECFLPSFSGCIYAWFSSAKERLTKVDVNCGHTDRFNYNTAQMFWANTNKIGCAYGMREMGDRRVICNFSPGAPFILRTKYYCGLLPHKEIILHEKDTDLTDLELLNNVGISKMLPFSKLINTSIFQNESYDIDGVKLGRWGVYSLTRLYPEGWVRELRNDYRNGSIGLTARLVTKYFFTDTTNCKCDSGEPIYKEGRPGMFCVETSRRFNALCYDFRDSAYGYRLIAVLAPIGLFALLLYDLFGGVMVENIY